jgi:hypothetical protein
MRRKRWAGFLDAGDDAVGGERGALGSCEVGGGIGGGG